MKEIIAKRNKKAYVFMLVISIITIITSTVYMRIPLMRYIAFPMIVLLSLSSVVWIYYIVDPRGVIEREGEKLILRRGMFKTVIDIKDILEVYITPHPGKKGVTQKSVISIKVIVNGKEKVLVCGDVLDQNAVIQRISNLQSAYRAQEK